MEISLNLKSATISAARSVVEPMVAGPLGTIDWGRDARRHGTRAGGLAHAFTLHRIARRCLGLCGCRDALPARAALSLNRFEVPLAWTGLEKITVHSRTATVRVAPWWWCTQWWQRPVLRRRRVGRGRGGARRGPRVPRLRREGPGSQRSGGRAARGRAANDDHPRALLHVRQGEGPARRVGTWAPVCRAHSRRLTLTVPGPAPRTPRPPAQRGGCARGAGCCKTATASPMRLES